MKLIKRKHYLDAVLSKTGQNMVVCITGQRRVGKSSILRTLFDELGKKEGANVIFVDKEKSTFDNLRSFNDLNAYIEARLLPEKHNYILVDEVQDIEGFEKSLCNFYDQDNVDIIVTGSNAKMFSGELATLISGRYLSVHVGSLTYEEFLTFHSLADTDEALNKYLNIGGLPNLRLLPIDDTMAVSDYLHGIFNTIVLKDIVARDNVRNISFLENLIRYIADNTGKLFSVATLSSFMLHEKEKISPDVIKKYMRSFCNAYIINATPRYDIHGKQLLALNEKYYFEDLGLRNILTSGNRLNDIEKLIENAVYLHLKHLGYKVNVGVLRCGEIDFVATRGKERVYVQATYLLASPETHEREFGNLKQIRDNYPKYVVSMDPFHLSGDEDGIHHLHLRQFLTTHSL